MLSLRLTYDPDADVAYLYLRPAAMSDVLGPTLLLERDAAFPGQVALDFRLADGLVAGLEFMAASRCLPATLLAEAERVENVTERMKQRLLRRFVRPADIED